MSYCQSSPTSDGEHRWEWWGEENGETMYRCMNAGCGEVKFQFVDTQGG
jgi:hypothetical protein